MKRFFPIFAFCLLAVSCSTTRVLEEGQYRLTSNNVRISGDSSLAENDVRAYIRQDAGSGGLLGFNPFLYVYNWSRRDGLFHKIGTAPVIYDERSVASSLSNIGNHLKYLGYYKASVDTATVRKGKKISVDYLITPGRQYRISDVVFEVPGYDSFHEDFCNDTTSSLLRLKGNWLSEKLLEEETVLSSSRLRNLGYYSLGKNNYSFEADTLGGSALLYYRISEYERNQSPENAAPLDRYRIGNVYVSLPAGIRFREKLLKGISTVRPGQIYSESNIGTTYSRLSALKVFSGVAIEMTQTDSSTVDCSINLSRSPLQGFKVNLEGSSNSSGLFGVSPQLSYFHKNFFHGGEWLNLVFNGDFQFKFNDPTRATEYGVSAGISFPRFLGLPYSYFRRSAIPRTDFNVAFNYQDRPEYTRSVFSLGYGYTGVTRHNFSYQIYPLRVNFVRLFNLDSQFSKKLDNNPYMRYSYQDHLDAGVSMTLYYNSSTEIIPASSYYFHRLSVDLSGNALSLFKPSMKKNADGASLIAGSPYAQYVRGEYSLGRTFRYGHEDMQAVATRLLIGAGYAFGNSSAMPFEKQFYAGGASSMRGWQARDLGPGFSQSDTTFVIPSQTGDIKIEMNAEYRFRLFWKLEGAVFADVGNVWNLSYDDTPEGRLGAFRLKDFYKSLAADWGAGLRVNLNFILLRVDFGMKLRDPSLKEGSRLIGPDQWLHRGNNAFHFGIGYPF